MLVLAQSDSGGGAIGFIILIGLGFYLVPTIVAVVRKVPNMGSVAVINILLGWSVVGWVVSMAMAVRSVPPAQHHGGHRVR